MSGCQSLVVKHAGLFSFCLGILKISDEGVSISGNKSNWAIFLFPIDLEVQDEGVSISGI